jgi:predicted site-specific integrase-resolvase
VALDVDESDAGGVVADRERHDFGRGVRRDRRSRCALCVYRATIKKADLERQLGRLSYATANGMSVVRSVAEIGSGLNGHPPKLRRLLVDPFVGTIVVEHRDPARALWRGIFRSGVSARVACLGF